MSVDVYPDRVSKLLLAGESAKVAKQFTVMEDGIGEDLCYNVMGWKDHSLTSIFQLKREFATDPSRLTRTLDAIAVARFGFDIDAVTFIAEGYCAMDPEKVDHTRPLSEQFVDNHEIRECITVTHIEDGVTEIVALPYSYAIPRRVQWSQPLRYPTHPTENEFVKSIAYILTLEPGLRTVGDAEWRAAMATDIEALGFHVHRDVESLDPDWGL